MRKAIALACVAALLVLPVVVMAQNVNSASLSELRASKCGLGEVKAQAVIDERAKGQFSNWSDFQTRVKGVGAKTVEKLQAKGWTCEAAEEKAE